MRFEDSNIPKRKSKPKPNVLEEHEPFLKLRAMIMGGKMKPFQQIGLFFGPEDVQKLNMKAPWRIATDRLRKLLRSTGMDADYQVVKYMTDTPGVWFVRVTYRPPTEQPAAVDRKRGRPRKEPAAEPTGFS